MHTMISKGKNKVNIGSGAEGSSSSSSSSVTTHVQLEEGMAGLTIANRPRTNLGPQGDHVSAYALFVFLLTEAVRGKSIKDATACLIRAVEYGQGTATQYDNLSDFIKTYAKTHEYMVQDLLSVEEMEQIRTKITEPVLLQKIQAGQDAIISRYLSSMVEGLTNQFLTFRNKLSHTAFAREGSMAAPDAEGAQIKQAIKGLREFNESALENNTELTAEQSTNALRLIDNLFFYPKIPASELIDMTTPAGQKQWDDIKAKRGYVVSAMPRDNNLDTLSVVVANHLSLIFACFESFWSTEAQKDVIITTFVGKIAKDWGLNPTETTALLTYVTKNLPAYLLDAKTATDSQASGSRRDSESSASADSHHSVPEGSLKSTDDEDEDFGVNEALSEETKTIAGKKTMITRSETKPKQ
jgi:hypothetical protein